MVCFNRRGQLQRVVVFFLQLWQVASTPGVSTAGQTQCVSGSLEGLLSAGGCGGVVVADKAEIQRQLLLL